MKTPTRQVNGTNKKQYLCTNLVLPKQTVWYSTNNSTPIEPNTNPVGYNVQTGYTSYKRRPEDDTPVLLLTAI